MCGRYTSTSTLTDLVRVFEVDEVRTEPEAIRYNVAPTVPVYAVAMTSKARRALGTFRWGLVPPWAKNPAVGSRMINARAETIATKPAYRTAVARRRCLIPADAFYEWQRGPEGKLPHAIRRRDRLPMAFAGIWEIWRDPDDPAVAPLRTCAIVTTAANDFMAPLHDRMPLVLAYKDWSAWLDPRTDFSVVRSLMVPPPSDWFDAYPVASLVNSVGTDGPELIRPLLPPPRG